MSLFLDGIFDQNNVSPSSVNISFPVIGQGFDSSLTGLLVSEPTMSSSINWGPILNDLSNIQDVASLIGSSQMWSWIGASAMCWKGTSPLKTSIEFYLINYKPGLKLEEKLKQLNYLTSLTRVDDAKIAVQVHGGYKAPVLQANSDYFNNNTSDLRRARTTIRGWMEGIGQDILGFKSNKDINMEEGTITIKFGRKMSINHMLIQKLDVTPSVVEVPDGKPLYYRVSMSLTGSRPLLSVDVDDMYRGG